MRVNLIKAMVPVLPIVLLSLDAAIGPFPLTPIAGAGPDSGGDVDRRRGGRADQSRGKPAGSSSAFFDGAGMLTPTSSR